MVILHQRSNSWFTCALLIFLPSIFTYNLDKNFPILYQRESTSEYFGYSVGLLRNKKGYRALITAPRANSSNSKVHQPGVLFSCDILLSEESPTCTEVALDRGNYPEQTDNSRFSYKEMQDDMWLGVDLDIQRNSTRNDVVVCGHLWKDKSFSRYRLYSVNGVCYVIDADLNTKQVKKLLPFVDKAKQTINNVGKYYFGFAQGGTSVTFSEDGQSLLIGSPGFFDWSGNIASYGNVWEEELPIIPETSKLNHHYQMSFNGYTGYSMTTGKFLDPYIVYIAAGAPRDGGQRGRVYIFSSLNERTKQLGIVDRKEGFQLGEYFGASVCGIDLNSDGLTDLLVGAPLYSEESGGDEGRVYVYISSVEGLRLHAELRGENAIDARFGTCIGDIGDLNQDGFDDVAVGAPYEDKKGAVYIYHGTVRGINTRYVQRIAASEMGSVPSGFGISISRGLDIDGNFYPDILIGAYTSSSAVLLRTYPIIRLMLTLEFEPSQINSEVKNCSLAGKIFRCFNIDYCLYYFGQHAPPNLEFEVKLELDSRREPTVRRGFFRSRENKMLISRAAELHSSSVGSCFQETAYINNKVRDEITPIYVSLNCTLDKEKTSVCRNQGFNKYCPIIDSSSVTNTQKSIPFQVDCGNDNRCSADLVVKARILESKNDAPFIIGKDDMLTLKVTIINEGEIAYSPVLFVYLPNEIVPVENDVCDIEKSQQKHDNTTLRCDVGNFIKAREQVDILIKIDLRKVSVNKQSFEISMNVHTVSEEINASNNQLSLITFLKAAADIRITGVTEEDQIFYTKEMNVVSIAHKYYVMNYGPSPVDKLEITLQVPVALMEEGAGVWVDFLNFTDFETDSSSLSTLSTRCNTSFIKFIRKESHVKQSELSALNFFNQTGNSSNTAATPEDDDSSSYRNTDGIQKRSVDDRYRNDTGTENVIATKEAEKKVLDCETAKCVAIPCVAGPFPVAEKSMRITVSVDLNLQVVNAALKNWEVTEFTTKGSISTNIAKAVERDREITVKSQITKELPEPVQKVENWKIFVGIGAGILLLLIILFVLIKIGFFKRQKKAQLKRMMFQASIKEEQQPVITSDTEEEDVSEVAT